MSEEDLRTLMRDFKASVAADLAEQHRRADTFADEMRDHVRLLGQRIGTAEVGIINEIRALANRFDLRMERLEHRIDGVEGTP